MGQIPKIDDSSVLVFIEDCLLDFHLHLDHLCFKVAVDLCICLFDQFFDVFLTKDVEKFN